VRLSSRRAESPDPGTIPAMKQITLRTWIASSGATSRCTLALTDLYPSFDGRIFRRRSCAGQTASELFQYAAHTLSTATAGCVVVQDSSFGIQAPKPQIGVSSATPPHTRTRLTMRTWSSPTWPTCPAGGPAGAATPETLHCCRRA